EQASPGSESKARRPRFLECRYFGHEGIASFTVYSQCPDSSSLDLRARVEISHHACRYFARGERLDDQSRSLVRNMNHFNIGIIAQFGQDEMGRCPIAIGSKVDLVRIFLGVGYELPQRFGRDF